MTVSFEFLNESGSATKWADDWSSDKIRNYIFLPLYRSFPAGVYNPILTPSKPELHRRFAHAHTMLFVLGHAGKASMMRRINDPLFKRKRLNIDIECITHLTVYREICGSTITPEHLHDVSPIVIISRSLCL